MSFVFKIPQATASAQDNEFLTVLRVSGFERILSFEWAWSCKSLTVDILSDSLGESKDRWMVFVSPCWANTDSLQGIVTTSSEWSCEAYEMWMRVWVWMFLPCVIWKWNRFWNSLKRILFSPKWTDIFVQHWASCVFHCTVPLCVNVKQQCCSHTVGHKYLRLWSGITVACMFTACNDILGHLMMPDARCHTLEIFPHIPLTFTLKMLSWRLFLSSSQFVGIYHQKSLGLWKLQI